MIFWFIIGLCVLFIGITIFLLITSIVSGDGDFLLGAVLSGLVTFMISLFVLIPWGMQASDLAKVTTQHHKVEVYENRINSLEERLNNANYPEKSVISMDNDSPWATMMKELSKAETKLADVRDERAEAIRSIEARKYGPMSGVVWLVGDIPENIKEDL